MKMSVVHYTVKIQKLLHALQLHNNYQKIPAVVKANAMKIIVVTLVVQLGQQILVEPQEPVVIQQKY